MPIFWVLLLHVCPLFLCVRACMRVFQHVLSHILFKQSEKLKQGQWNKWFDICIEMLSELTIYSSKSERLFCFFFLFIFICFIFFLFHFYIEYEPVWIIQKRKELYSCWSTATTAAIENDNILFYGHIKYGRILIYLLCRCT